MTMDDAVLLGASAIEMLAAVVIVVHAVWALATVVRGRGLDAARLIVANGVLAALGFSLAATLLKVIGLQQWVQIRTFATVFVLRTALKYVFTTERNLIQRRTVDDPEPARGVLPTR